MRVAVLFSGGKDSCYTVWLLQHQGWEVSRLVTIKPNGQDSMMFHYPNVEWTGLQAEAMDIPHSLIEGGDELGELQETLETLRRKERIVGIATGAVASDFQKSRFDRVSDSVGLRSFSPLWHKDPGTIVQDLIKAEFRTIISGVAASGLDRSWLGREMTAPWWEKLADLSERHGIHLSGEGGEYETFVIDAPHFKKRIIVEKSTTVWEGQSGYFKIEKASARDKLAN
ncbi:diphthine--ammonia ligase [Candidatus Bathyarchaeota archaeon]|nr:MAG: diphthine--ammonia ligase [Candidatus Bathyarchaeota archaeon]TMI33184.1 MAG: diphthine--ammonia ligase [Candidatus Bathyarchaeota archaeon]